MIQPEKLLAFHLGSVSEEERLRVEQELLVDPEALLDYLDLKRSAEAAQAIPSYPSEALWRRLSRTASRRHWAWVSIASGVAAAAVVCFFVFKSEKVPTPASAPTSNQEILFDSGAEHSAASNVL